MLQKFWIFLLVNFSVLQKMYSRESELNALFPLKSFFGKPHKAAARGKKNIFQSFQLCWKRKQKYFWKICINKSNIWTCLQPLANIRTVDLPAQMFIHAIPSSSYPSVCFANSILFYAYTFIYSHIRWTHHKHFTL